MQVVSSLDAFSGDVQRCYYALDNHWRPAGHEVDPAPFATRPVAPGCSPPEGCRLSFRQRPLRSSSGKGADWTHSLAWAAACRGTVCRCVKPSFVPKVAVGQTR